MGIEKHWRSLLFCEERLKDYDDDDDDDAIITAEMNQDNGLLPWVDDSQKSLILPADGTLLSRNLRSRGARSTFF